MHGNLKEDFWVVKLNKNGTIKWQQALGSTEFEEAKSVDQTKDGGYVVAGWTGFANNNNGDVSGTHGDYDFWIVKLTETAHTSITNSLSGNNLRFSLSPNPVHDFIQLEIYSDKATALVSVTNSNDNVVMQRNISINKKLQLQLDVSKFFAGVYYVTVSSGMEVTSRQFIKN